MTFKKLFGDQPLETMSNKHRLWKINNLETARFFHEL